MKVILDTNIFVAAGFNPDSSAARAVQAVRDGRLTLVWNETTMRETRRVVGKIPPLDWNEFAELYTPDNRFNGETEPQNFPAVEGRLDREFAALSKATGALLVFNDDHLLGVRDQLPITVMSSGQFARNHLPH
ncbi:MAG: putative toxin-antitoxin system toxin component, PIN family [Phycisphaerae bacterium]